ncbi:MAG TPA: pilus assembly protein PilM [Candidatus Babeliales bacterium]|nr:pilus assembly protein PilM [Candidatus Babeliales bacterium]
MIRGVIFPEKIGSYYLFSKRIIGIEISKESVTATKIVLKGRVCIIEKSVTENLMLEAGNYVQEVVRALAVVIKKCGSYDVLISSLAGITPVTKEIAIPFSDHDKINKIVNFEIEPELPFSLDEAVIDYVITSTGDKDSLTTVLIVAISKKALQEHTAYFDQVFMGSPIITLDTLALVSLYSQAPEYSKLTGSVVIITLGKEMTNISYFENRHLRRMRTLNMGISIESTQQYTDQELKNILLPLLTQIQFTINAIAKQIQKSKDLSQIILVGPVAQIEHIKSLFQSILNAPCMIFDIQEVLKNPFFQKGSSVDMFTLNQHVISLATAVPQLLNQDFNLAKDAQKKANYRFFLQQFIVASSLALFIILLLVIHSFFSIRSLKHEALASQQEVMQVIQDTFKIEDEESLDDAVDKVNEQITQEEKRWLMFAPQMRSLFLYYLQELSKVINRKELGLQLQKLSIDDAVIEFQGSVRDFEAVNKFEAELKKTKLFVFVPDLQNANFEAEPLRLQIKRKIR